MKSFLKKLIVLIAIVLSVSFITNLTSSSPTHAAITPCRELLYLKSWDCGIEDAPTSTDQIKSNTVIIASNVLADIGVIAGFLVLGYVIYGGYLYMFASGDPGKVAAGKKTLTHAFIGFGITILANVIINTIRIALLGEAGAFSYCGDLSTGGSCTDSTTAAELVRNMISWAIGMAGVAAVIFIVIGGISYVTSAGDPNKVQKAKQTITYALIGLAIVGLAEIIVAIVSSILIESETTSISSHATTQIISSIKQDNKILFKKGIL